MEKNTPPENSNLFCKEAGIEHQLTAPYTPQQNGVGKRRNKYIMEMTRCILHEKEWAKNFRAEAANTVVFLQTDFQPRQGRFCSKLGMGINLH